MNEKIETKQDRKYKYYFRGENMKVAFVLQVSSHARYLRRIDKMKELGIEAKVFAFERDFYKGKIENRDYISLGNVERENYLKRIKPIIMALFKLRNQLDSADVIYTFGVDTFIIGWIASLLNGHRTKIVYEVGDIRTVVLKENIVGKLFRFLERRVLNRADLLVVTSGAFIENYFMRIQKTRDIKYHIIENKPELTEEKEKKEKNQIEHNDKITIGYFGVIRCRRSIEILKEIMLANRNKFNLYIRGIPSGTDDLIREIRDLEGVEIQGEYTVPDDLYNMYSKADVIWACYPFQGEKVGNWNWAKTTRFYEACFFNKPMISQKGSQDSLIVKKYGIGIDIDLSDINKTALEVNKLSLEDITSMKLKFKKVPSEVFKYRTEHEDLLKKLK